MRLLRRLVREQRGVSMIIAVLLTSVLGLIAVNIFDVVQTENTRSASDAQRQASFAAAEAGIDDYMTKLVSDPTYYYHDVAAGEATRKGTTSGTSVSASSSSPTAWSAGDTSWSYPNGKDTWRTLGNGYQYNLEITPPSSTAQYTQILSTGEKTGATTNTRIIQVWVRPSVVSDYYRIVDGDVGFGSNTTTNGAIYSSGNVTHDGTATANIYAEGTITGSVTLQNGAQEYTPSTNPSIRSVISSPLNFSDFIVSLSDLSRAAQAGGVYLNNTSIDAWKLVFSSNGTFTAQTCTKSSGQDVAATAPTCGTTTTYSVPSNGAIYSPQTVIVSGTVKGRVTVASNNNIVVATNISYVTTGNDVLGLDSANNVYVAAYAPSTLSWRAAVLAQSGTWRSWNCPAEGSGTGTMTFVGSAATDDGGCFTAYDTRNYTYDSSLLYLEAPWFPAISTSFTTLLFRELPAP
jgi:Tfp pilus assembly protein PilX